MKKIFIFQLLFSLILILVCSKQSSAKEFNVINGDELRLAITEANQNSEDDIINLAPGNYNIEGPPLDNENSTGDLDIKSNLTLKGENPRNTILQGNGDDRIIHIMEGAIVKIESITIAGGATKDGNGGSGALGGGGILVDSSTGTFSKIIVKMNIAPNNNGGAGIWSNNSVIKLYDSLIVDNETEGGGGGGIVNVGGELEIINSTISENISGSSGGGMNIASGTATILNSTITGNGALSSGGEGITDGGADITLGNTIVAGNTSPPNSNADYEGIFTSLGGNIIGNNGETNPIKFIIINNQQPSDQIGTADNPIAPLLGPLQNNGGPTDTHELLAGSPALNMGEDGICESEDQRGVVRPLGGKCDSGAFEVGCGDGAKEANEACDDGNNTDGDGCSSICKLESTDGGGGNNNTPSSGGCGQLNPGPMHGLGYGVILLISLFALVGLRKIKS